MKPSLVRYGFRCGESTRAEPAPPRGGSKVCPPICSTSENATSVSNIGTSRVWPWPDFSRSYSAIGMAYARVRPATLSARRVLIGVWSWVGVQRHALLVAVQIEVHGTHARVPRGAGCPEDVALGGAPP